MSKLEEQLRESRQEVRSDLQPPAGGWEAIQAGIAAAAAGGTAGVGAGSVATAAEAAAVGNAAGAASGAAGTAAATGAGSTLFGGLVKTIVGLSLLGGLATGAWFTLSDAESATPEPGNTTTITAPQTATATESSRVLSEGQPAVTPTETIVETEVPKTSEPADAAAPRAASPDAPQVKDAGGNQAQSVTGVIPTATAEEPITSEAADRPSAQLGNQRAISDAPHSSNPAHAADPATSAGDGVVAANDEVGEQPSAIMPEDEQGATVPPTEGFTQVATPVASQSRRPIDPLPTDRLNNVSESNQIIFTGFDDLSGVIEEDGKFRKIKRAVRPSWQLHGGVNVLGSNNAFSFGGTQRLQRVENGTGAFEVVLPDGELVSANFSGAFSFTNSRTDNFMARLGVTRQTSWGGSWRGTLGFFHGRETSVDDRSQLASNELVFDNEGRTTAVSLEAGFQYTFLRRHKFRPFVGINGMLFLAYRNTREQFIFDAQTGQRALQDLNEDRSPIPLVVDLSLTTGFQYQLTKRLSVGPYLWVNGGVRYWLEAPFGLEARYIIK